MRLAGADGFTHALRKVGIIILRIAGKRTEVIDLVAPLSQVGADLFLERKARVV
jgi:hypothetical protein